MNDDLPGYIVGAVSPEERASIEQRLKTDASFSARESKLRSLLAPLESIRSVEPPPAGMADRTILRAFPKTTVSGFEGNFSVSSWSLWDVAFAAAVMLIVSGLGLSATNRAREAAVRAECQDNLRTYYGALAAYALNHNGYFPAVSDKPPFNRAGAFHTLLKNAGVMPATNCLLCPSRAECAVYAYALGYRSQDGNLVGLRYDQPERMPMISDRSFPRGHGNGYNILYSDGYVTFSTTADAGYFRDNIFVNDEFVVAAGIHRLDSVLAVGDTAP